MARNRFNRKADEAEANARQAAEKDRQRGWSPESAEAWARAHGPSRGK